jgi:hypothetical protein
VRDNYIGLDRFGKYLPNTGEPVEDKGHHNRVEGNVVYPRG